MSGLKTALAAQANVGATLFCAVLTFTLIKSSMFLPGQYYFTFSGFLFAGDVATAELLRPDETAAAILGKSWIGLVFKLLIPVAAGMATALVWAPASVENAARLGAVAAAFLLTWPALSYWDVIVHPEVATRRNVFLVMYALYWIAYLLLAGVGAQIGTAVADGLKGKFDLTKAVSHSAYASVSAALGVGAAYAFSD